MPDSFKPDPDAVCERCGCYGAYRFDGQTLCGDCYETRGACCPEGAAFEEPDDDEPPVRPASRPGLSPP